MLKRGCTSWEVFSPSITKPCAWAYRGSRRRPSHSTKHGVGVWLGDLKTDIPQGVIESRPHQDLPIKLDRVNCNHSDLG